MGFLRFLARFFGWGRSNQIERAELEPGHDHVDQESDDLGEGPVAAAPEAPATAPEAPNLAPPDDAPSGDETDDEDTAQFAGAMMSAGTDDLDDVLSAAFLGDAGGDSAGIAIPAPEPVQEGGPRDLFAGIASNYARPVKNFMCDLKRGEATKQWIEICLPVTNTIIEAAESLDLTTVAQRMTDFGEALSIAQGEQGHVLRGESRDLLLSCYDELVELLPETFVLEERDERRESIIIHSLLQQIEGVGHVTFEKLYAAGLTTLEALVLATPGDLAVVAGVPLFLCEKVCEKVQRHHEQLTGDSTDGGQSFLRARLNELMGELRAQHEIFEAACVEPTPSEERDARKRDSRRDRQACALRINVLLAEMGNLDLVEEIQKLSFGRRIEKLEKYVKTLNDEFLATPVLAIDAQASSSQPPTSR